MTPEKTFGIFTFGLLRLGGSIPRSLFNAQATF
jgi:hypothetical protein